MFPESVSSPKISSNGDVTGPLTVDVSNGVVPDPRAAEARSDRPGSRGEITGALDGQQGSGNQPENGDSVEENAPAADAKLEQKALF